MRVVLTNQKRGNILNEYEWILQKPQENIEY